MPTTIAINSRTSGKFTRETINGRPHIATIMMPIRGDISMNQILYSDDQVDASFKQLDLLPAPNGHPVINGIHTVAMHPVANNTFNIGGWIRNPRKKGKRVFVDFLLDEKVANNSEAGKALIARIESGEKVGVSTGLNIGRVEEVTGVDDFGKPYTRKGYDFKFDHVAILLEETAAGDHAGTELVLNEGTEEEIFVCNMLCNELSANELRDALEMAVRNEHVASGNISVWVNELYPDSKSFVYEMSNDTGTKLFRRSYDVDGDKISLENNAVEVVRKVEFIQPTGEDAMDKEKLVLAIIGNSANKFTGEDKDKLMSMSESDLVMALCVNKITEDDAKKVLSINSDHYASYTENKGAFDAFMAAEAVRVAKIKTSIIANSEYTEALLDGKSSAELEILANAIVKPKPADRIGAGSAPNKPGSEMKCNYDMGSE